MILIKNNHGILYSKRAFKYIDKTIIFIDVMQLSLKKYLVMGIFLFLIDK